MLLTFSPGPPPSANEDQPQPMEDESQQPSQQHSTFQMPSSASSIDDGYVGFNYNFGFDTSATAESGASTAGLTSRINFGNWTSLGSPMITSLHFFSRQAPMTTVWMVHFLLLHLTTVVWVCGESFFFGNGGDPVINKQVQDGK